MENGFLATNKDFAATSGLAHQSTSLDSRRPGPNHCNGLVSKHAIIWYIERVPHAVRTQFSQHIGNLRQP